MPFGLCNAPATFQRLMDSVLAGLHWRNCLVYIDDIVVIGKSFDEHLCNLQQVLERLRQAGLKLQPHKVQVFTETSDIPGACCVSTGCIPRPRENKQNQVLASTPVSPRGPTIFGASQLLPLVY